MLTRKATIAPLRSPVTPMVILLDQSVGTRARAGAELPRCGLCRESAPPYCMPWVNPLFVGAFGVGQGVGPVDHPGSARYK